MDGGLSDDAGLGEGGKLLQKNAKSFLKRMAKAFAGGGGGKGGVARTAAEGDDTWDAAQTVNFSRIFSAFMLLNRIKSLILKCSLPCSFTKLLRERWRSTQTSKQKSRTSFHSSLPLGVTTDLPQQVTPRTPRYREVLIDLLVKSHATDATSRQRQVAHRAWVCGCGCGVGVGVGWGGGGYWISQSASQVQQREKR
jgi:hypothetical protein